MKETKPIPFWGDSPFVLIDSKYIGEIFPANKQTTNQKYNSLTRLIIITTIILLIFTLSLTLLLVSILSIIGIYFTYYNSAVATDSTTTAIKEGFTSPTQLVTDMMTENGIDELPPKGVFDDSTPINPFSNVLLTDYNFNPNKKPAEPAFTESVMENINSNTKKMVQQLNPKINDLEAKIYRGVGDKLSFEQSMQRFVSNPGTTIPNNDKAFKEFCYGGMKSCKEGNPFACAQNMSRRYVS
jgi:hypothetical protein